MNVNEVLELIKEQNIKIVDLRFTDMLGTWHHTSVPAIRLTEDAFTDGFGIDGSSIKGWRAIDSSDMLIMPDPESAFLDPFYDTPTISMICDIYDPITGTPYSRNPRYIAQKALAYLKSTGLADTCYIGPELEFIVMDNVQYAVTPQNQFYTVDIHEAGWNSGREEIGGNIAGKIELKGGYFPVPPVDSLQDLRSEMVVNLMEIGLPVECHHHEVAVGQCEIDIRFDTLLKQADNVMKYKYVVRNTAAQNGKVVTFMPKPLFGDSGNGMHTHISLWKEGKPLFAGNDYAGLSDMALYFIGGILKHAKALAAFTNPTLNSYRRLIPGYEAPVNLAYSSRNRSASIRIPMYSASPKAKRVEVRFPDPMANPYMSFSAIMMAGIDGVLNKIDPGPAMDKNLYDLDPIELADVPQLPGSLEEAMTALENDYSFLLKGDTFTEEFIFAWIELKRTLEIEPERLKPTPFEYQLYFNQ
ncbi:MAG: type I glutamate--ammonia ligase [Deferribacteraceae bacterium]|jgi:glutamine synthetase|nr:type I glutamate--ammonia ligase [Deferribacteraceae bacterium]